jgi:hypothetical protein
MTKKNLKYIYLIAALLVVIIAVILLFLLTQKKDPNTNQNTTSNTTTVSPTSPTLTSITSTNTVHTTQVIKTGNEKFDHTTYSFQYPAKYKILPAYGDASVEISPSDINQINDLDLIFADENHNELFHLKEVTAEDANKKVSGELRGDGISLINAFINSQGLKQINSESVKIGSLTFTKIKYEVTPGHYSYAYETLINNIVDSYLFFYNSGIDEKIFENDILATITNTPNLTVTR